MVITGVLVGVKFFLDSTSDIVKVAMIDLLLFPSPIAVFIYFLLIGLFTLCFQAVCWVKETKSMLLVNACYSIHKYLDIDTWCGLVTVLALTLTLLVLIWVLKALGPVFIWSLSWSLRSLSLFWSSQFLFLSCPWCFQAVRWVKETKGILFTNTWSSNPKCLYFETRCGLVTVLVLKLTVIVAKLTL